MSNVKKLIAATTLVTLAGLWTSWSLAGSEENTGTLSGTEALTKEQAIEKALAEHPGEVRKAYKETKRGKEVWEVQVKGEDGKEWELYYDAKTGELVKAKSD